MSMRRLRKLTEQLCETKQSDVQTKPCSATAMSLPNPVKVLVTGAAGNIAYSILFGIGRGKLLGENGPKIDLCLLDIPVMERKMQGVVMELKDCAFSHINSITATVDYKTAFENTNIALLIGARPRGKGMLRADLLKANAKIFEGQGKAIEKYSSKDIKVVVVGNPANTNCLITMTNAPSIPRSNFTAMTRLDQNRAVGQIAEKLNVGVDKVKNVIIWGNHSKTQYPDVHHGYVDLKQGSGQKLRTSILSSLQDKEWVFGEFISRVQQRGAEIIKARGLSSAASAANACLDHVRDWILGTQPGQWVSMAVESDGSYGVPRGIVYSFPVTCQFGEYYIVKGLPINEFSRKKMMATADELLQERKTALGV